ncbi:MAG TPA: MFS transporter [Actinospica sp.]|nr:MFS transporter [Actinospica sp.]
MPLERGDTLALCFFLLHSSDPPAHIGRRADSGSARRGHALGVLSAVVGAASVGGQLLGGLLIGADLFGSSRRPIFWVNVPVGLATLLLAARWIPENRSEQTRRLDPPGMAVLCAVVCLLVIPLIEGRQLGWPAWTWAAFAAGLALAGVFVLVERRVTAAGGSPLVVLRVFTERAFALGIVAVLAGGGLRPWELMPSLAAQGVGGGLMLTPLFGAVFSRIGADEVGTASGALSTTQQIGGAIGVAVVGVLFFGALTRSGATTAGYAHSFALGCGVITLLAAVAGALVFALTADRAPGRRRRA